MAFKITTKEYERLVKLAEQYTVAENDVLIALERFNAVRTDIRSVLEDHQNDFQGQWDDKSETWKEGERGDAVADWITTIETLMEGLDRDIEIEDEFNVEDLTGLETEPNV